jgi:hypothetical protein
MDVQIFFDAGLAWGIFITLIGALTAIQGICENANTMAWTGISVTGFGAALVTASAILSNIY